MPYIRIHTDPSCLENLIWDEKQKEEGWFSKPDPEIQGIERPPVRSQCSRLSGEDFPVSEKSAPVTENGSPVAEQSSPVEEKGSLVAENCSPVTENCSPVTENCSPVAEKGSPVTENCSAWIEKSSRRTLHRFFVLNEPKSIQEDKRRYRSSHRVDEEVSQGKGRSIAIFEHKTLIMSKQEPTIIRCSWCTEDPVYRDYHDKEWGVPVHDDRHLFEMLILEGAQAGLSWITILKRRDGYRKAFDRFNAVKISKYSEEKIQELIQDPGIIRNELKIRSVVNNAKAFLKTQKEFGTFDNYLWQFTDYRTIQTSYTDQPEVPVTSPEAEALSKDLQRRGFKFTGPTICYAFMQAIGMVDDHIEDCWKRHQPEMLMLDL